MADNNLQNNKFLSKNDALDINELASLNEEITPEFIEQLQNKVSQTANKLNQKESAAIDTSDDTTLFEEVQSPQQQANENPDIEIHQNNEEKQETSPRTKVNIDNTIDDNFIKKYKAKLNKQEAEAQAEANAQAKAREEMQNSATTQAIKTEIKESADNQATGLKENKEIENLTSGNILEKPATTEQINYNDTLDYLDNNVKYTKYVIYIDPENKDFIDSLTIKERKNLINRILRQQDDIAITKRRLGMVQTVIKHSIIAILTITIAIPAIYFTINTSLEATINNYRRSQSIFQTLYREHGKIKTNTSFK